MDVRRSGALCRTALCLGPANLHHPAGPDSLPGPRPTRGHGSPAQTHPGGGFSRSYLPVQKKGEISSPQLAAKVDGLLFRVCQILGMPAPSQRKPLHIYLMADGKEVRKMYLFLNPDERSSIFGYGSMEGFYEPRSRSIFVSLRDLHAGILGHEMGHHVLCTVPRTPLAPGVQEDLCREMETRIF